MTEEITDEGTITIKPTTFIVQYFNEKLDKWVTWHEGKRQWDKDTIEDWGAKVQYNWKHMPHINKYRVQKQLKKNLKTVWEGVNT